MQINTNALSALNPNAFKTRRRKFGVGSLLLLLVLGAVFTAIGFALFSTTKINASWKRVDGTIVSSSAGTSGSGGTTYTAIVGYTVNGQAYKVSGNSSSSIHPSIGRVSQVAYNPSDPQDAKVVDGAGTKAILLLFPAIGVCMLVLGPVLFIRSLRRSEDINNLKQTGQKVQGVITDIQSQSSGSNQGGSGYRIVVSATAPDGSVQQYASDWLQGIGGLAMTDFRANPVAIDVYVDPANAQNYYVDVSEVPNLTPERITELIQSAAQHKVASVLNPAQAALQPQQAPVQPVVPTQPAPPAGDSQAPPPTQT